jgi:hypothetical protein
VYNCVARSLVRRGRGLVDSVYVDSSQREHQQRADYLGMFASEVVFKVSRCQTSFMRVLVNSRMSPSECSSVGCAFQKRPADHGGQIALVNYSDSELSSASLTVSLRAYKSVSSDIL